MTTKTTITHEKILDSKKFENLPFHKGQVSLKASQTAKLDDLDLEYEYDRAIEYAKGWGEDDVNKAIKQIKNDPNITEYQRQKAFEELDAFLGNTNPNPRAAAALDKWRKPKDYDYDEAEKKFLESLANKKGGKRRRKKKTRKKKKKRRHKKKTKRRRKKKTRKKRGGERRKGDWIKYDEITERDICIRCNNPLMHPESPEKTAYMMTCGCVVHTICLRDYCSNQQAQNGELPPCDGVIGEDEEGEILCGDEEMGYSCTDVDEYLKAVNREEHGFDFLDVPDILANPQEYWRQRQFGGKRKKRKPRRKKGGKTTVLGFPLPIFDLWQTKVKVNNTRKEVKQWKEFIEKKTKKGGRRKKRTRRKRGGNKQLSDKQTFLKEVKKNEKKLKPMFTEFMNRFIISKKTITFNMVLKEIENMKDSEFEKNINNIINNKSRSKKGGVWLPDPTLHLTRDDNVDTYNCTLLAILIIFAASQILFLYELMTNRQGVRFGLQPAIDNMRDILGPILYFVNIFCRLWAVFHNHAPHLEPAGVRRQNNARDIMQQINHVEPMIIRQRLLEEAPDSVGTFDWQAMESFLNEVRQILEEFEIRYYAPADSTAGTKRGI